jgi:hypothetical protein
MGKENKPNNHTIESINPSKSTQVQASCYTNRSKPTMISKTKDKQSSNPQKS